MPFWIVGTLSIGLYRLTGWVFVRRMRNAAIRVVEPSWQNSLQALAARIGVTKAVTLFESGIAGVPLLIGYLQPSILVPAGMLTALPVEQIEAILLHELAHVRRLDYLVNLIQTAVESFLFYHPAVWWVSSVMRTEREHCCDDDVIAIQGDARGYAAALLELEERRWAAAEPAVAAAGGNLMNRVRRLINQSPDSGPGLPVFAAGLLTAAACVYAMAQQGSAPASASPFQKWINEDVVYIAADAEKSAFERLQTNEERKEFIRQFWLRRDPTPGTPANEFQDEHYRRIAYANKRFADSGAGWATDRGRIYITFGPPDELELHPQQRREAWLYRHIDGLGDNVIFEFLESDDGVKRLSKTSHR